MTDDRARAVEAQNTPVRAAAMLLLELIGGGSVEDAEDAVRAILAAARSQSEAAPVPACETCGNVPCAHFWAMVDGLDAQIPKSPAPPKDEAREGPDCDQCRRIAAEHTATMRKLAAANAKLAEAEAKLDKVRDETAAYVAAQHDKTIDLLHDKLAAAEAQAGRMREAIATVRAEWEKARDEARPHGEGWRLANEVLDALKRVAALSAAPTGEPRPLPAGEEGES